MKVGIIAANNIRYSPYIFLYTELLRQIQVDYELIIPDRNDIQDSFDGVVHVLPWDRKGKTAINYVVYANAVTRLVKKQAYDALIVLTSVNAAYLGLWLKRHYKGRYIVDVRDYTHENIYPYYLLETVAMRNSLMNVISSGKFREFLPEAQYHVCHNYNSQDARNVKASFSRPDGVVTIGYVGALSYVEQCKKLMELVSRDDRFRLEFYGTSPEEPVLKAFAETLPGSSIRFHGGYVAAEKSGIIRSVDILFNAYGNGTPLLDCALSNKLYDALIYRKPILTCPNTCMTEMGGELSFPIDLPAARDLDDLYEWYTHLDGAAVDAFAADAMERIIRENRQTVELAARRLQSILK